MELVFKDISTFDPENPTVGSLLRELDGLWNTLGVEADGILDQEFVNKKRQEDEVLEQIKEEYNFDEIKDAFDEGTVPQQLDFFYGDENSNFN